MQILTIAGTEIVRMTRSRSFYVVLFLMPFLLILILGNALSGIFAEEGRPIDPARVAVANMDTGALADGLRSFFDAPDVQAHLSTVPAPSREEAVKLVRDGKADFALIVPAGFGNAVTSGRRAEWEYVYGRDRTKNRIAEHTLNAFIEQANTAQAAATVLGPQAIASLQQAGTAGTPPVTVRIGTLTGANKTVSALQYYSAAYLVMFLLYGGMMAATSLAKEREDRTLGRLFAMPVTAAGILAGKMLGQSVLAVVQAAVIVFGTRLLYGVDWGNGWGYLIAVAFLTIVASMSLAVAVASVAKTVKSVIALFQVIIIVMTMLSGGFSPVSGLMQKLGTFTVSHWASDTLVRIMLGSDSATIAGNVAVLSCIAAALLVFALAIYRKVGYHE